MEKYMRHLFKDTINSNNWGKLFQSIEKFTHLINFIFKKEQLANPIRITNLTPGTNAVFKVDQYVIKIYAPKESGFSSTRDYQIELQALNWCKSCGVACPNVIAANVVKDKYLFYYIIMDYIDGDEAGSILKHYTESEYILFAKQIRLITRKLNQKHDIKEFEIDILKQIKCNKKWDQYDINVKNQIFNHVSNLNLDNCVYVHGDLTNENILITSNYEPFVIDFADSLLAPYYYEFPPILFDLFDFNLTLIKAYLIDADETVIDDIFNGLLIHHYGPDYIKIIFERLKKQKINQLHDIYELKILIKDYIFNSL